jgi:hypothetical protein
LQISNVQVAERAANPILLNSMKFFRGAFFLLG